MRTIKNKILIRPGYKKWWDQWAADMFDERFVEYVEKMVKEL